MQTFFVTKFLQIKISYSLAQIRGSPTVKVFGGACKKADEVWKKPVQTGMLPTPLISFSVPTTFSREMMIFKR
jgi:hypothetical protein